MSSQTLAILVAIAIAGYVLYRLIRPFWRAAEEKSQARYDAAEGARLAQSRQKLEAELTEFPAKYQAAVEKCRPFERDTYVADYLKRASDQFAEARNFARIGDVGSAQDRLMSAHFDFWEAEKLAANKASDKESALLLRDSGR